MDKFVTSIKKNTIERLGENITNEQETHQKELEDNEIIQQKYNNENSPNNVQTSNVTIIDNEKQNNSEENEKKILIYLLIISMIQVNGKILMQN